MSGYLIAQCRTYPRAPGFTALYPPPCLNNRLNTPQAQGGRKMVVTSHVVPLGRLKKLLRTPVSRTLHYPEPSLVWFFASCISTSPHIFQSILLSLSVNVFPDSLHFLHFPGSYCSPSTGTILGIPSTPSLHAPSHPAVLRAFLSRRSSPHLSSLSRPLITTLTSLLRGQPTSSQTLRPYISSLLGGGLQLNIN